MSERYDNIEQLDQLRDKGSITEEEYEKEKTRILRSVDAPQRTVVETRERSSFGSIVFGGIVLFAILAGLYYLLMQGGSEQSEPNSVEITAPQLPIEENGGAMEGEVTVTSGTGDDSSVE